MGIRHEKGLAGSRAMVTMARMVLLAAAVSGACAFAGERSTARDAVVAKHAERGLKPCVLPDFAGDAYCGDIAVPENPDQPGGRQLSIHFAVVPATDGPALSDPIVPLMGGPGEDAISATAVFAENFADLRRDRDLLLVDQRGTGRSSALRCDLHAGVDPAISLRHLFPPEAAQRCMRELASRADLGQYTYENAARDLERVRRALGYGRLNLSGGSYGTRAAQVFMRMYPASVRTVYMGSAIPLDVATPLTMAKTAQVELERTLHACETDDACRAAFPDVRREFDAISARLEKGEAKVRGANGQVLTLSRGRVAEWFRSRLYRPSGATQLPWLIHQAYGGNWKPVADGIFDNAKQMPSALSVGLLLAITCREDVAFIMEDAIGPATRGTFLRDYRVREQQGACAQWPSKPLPEGYRRPVRSDLPTMFVSGDRDAASPLWFTQRVAPGFAHRVEIIAHNQGHTEWSDCIATRYSKFVRSGSVEDVESGACTDTALPPFRLK